MGTAIDIGQIVQILADIATSASIILAIFLYLRDRKSERDARAVEAYDRLDERFIDYIRLCLDHPDLDVFEIPLAKQDIDESVDTRSRQRKELIIFTVLVAIFERAYITYMKEDSTNNAISEWQAYMRLWCAQEHFQWAWQQINIQNQLRRQPGVEDTGTGYNVAFVQQMNMWIEAAQRQKQEQGRHESSQMPMTSPERHADADDGALLGLLLTADAEADQR